MWDGMCPTLIGTTRDDGNVVKDLWDRQSREPIICSSNAPARAVMRQDTVFRDENILLGLFSNTQSHP